MRYTILGLCICTILLTNVPDLGAQTSLTGGTLKWKFQTGTIYNSSPSIGSDGVVYIGGDDKYLYAINPGGTLKWKFLTGNSVYSSPSIGSDGTVYVGSQDNYLYAINPAGTLKWKFQTGNSVYSSPAIGSDGTVYVGSLNNYLYAVNAAGTLKWKFQTGNSVFSSPAVGSDGTIYVGSYDKYLYAINPGGILKWKFQTGSQVGSSPAIGSDGTIYVGSLDNYLYAINPDGTLGWTFKTGSAIDSSPSIGSDGTIYVGSNDKYLYAINPWGALKWKYLSGGIISPSPSIGSDGTVYFGCDDGYLYAINFSGALKWKYQTAATVLSSPAIGSDGTVYVGSYDDNLYAVNSGVPGGLANSAWPKKHHDNQNTGRLVSATTGTIAGTVTNPGSGLGYSGVTITVTPGNYTGTTNSKGGYAIANIPPGTAYTVRATLNGSNGGYQIAIMVTAGNITTVNFTWTLQSSYYGIIAGIIYDSSSGVGISGATVTVDPGNYKVTTNSGGGYTIINVLPSVYKSYTVRATAINYNGVSKFPVKVTDHGNVTTVDFTLLWQCAIYPSVKDTPLVKNALISPGDDFVVTINAWNMRGLFGTSFILNYTQSAYITVKSVESQGFLGSAPAFFSDQTTMGKVKIGVSAKKGVSGMDGDGILAQITFHTLPTITGNAPVIFSLSDVTAINSAGQILTVESARTDTLMIRSEFLTIWPGDMDNDGDVDQADVLKLGVYFEKTGSTRTNASMTWSGQTCLVWNIKEAAYADADGDGKVNQTDLLAIGLNWGSTHAVSKITSPTLSAERISGSLCLRSDAVFPMRAGSDFWVDVNVNDAVSLFGLSFILSCDQSSLLRPLSAEQGTFLGSDPIFFSQVSTEKGTVAVGMSRKSDESSLDGSGTVLRIKFKAMGDVEKDDLINFVFRDIVANDASGNSITLAAMGENIGDPTEVRENTPLSFRLAPNYPNPFNPNTTITFSIPEEGAVSLTVYDINGRLVRTLVSRILSAGIYSEKWDGRDDSGRPVSSGVYLSRLTQGGHSAMSKMMLMK